MLLAANQENVLPFARRRPFGVLCGSRTLMRLETPSRMRSWPSFLNLCRLSDSDLLAGTEKELMKTRWFSVTYYDFWIFLWGLVSAHEEEPRTQERGIRPYKEAKNEGTQSAHNRDLRQWASQRAASGLRHRRRAAGQYAAGNLFRARPARPLPRGAGE